MRVPDSDKVNFDTFDYFQGKAGDMVERVEYDSVAVVYRAVTTAQNIKQWIDTDTSWNKNEPTPSLSVFPSKNNTHLDDNRFYIAVICVIKRYRAYGAYRRGAHPSLQGREPVGW